MIRTAKQQAAILEGAKSFRGVKLTLKVWCEQNNLPLQPLIDALDKLKDQYEGADLLKHAKNYVLAILGGLNPVGHEPIQKSRVHKVENTSLKINNDYEQIKIAELNAILWKIYNRQNKGSV